MGYSNQIFWATFLLFWSKWLVDITPMSRNVRVDTNSGSIVPPLKLKNLPKALQHKHTFPIFNHSHYFKQWLTVIIAISTYRIINASNSDVIEFGCYITWNILQCNGVQVFVLCIVARLICTPANQNVYNFTAQQYTRESGLCNEISSQTNRT